MARTSHPTPLDPLTKQVVNEQETHPNSGLDHRNAVVVSTLRRPENEIDALMQCAPGEEPEVSKAELLHLREVLQDAIERLSEREQFIFNAIAVERLSFRETARRLSLAKSHVHRLYAVTCATLALDLGDQPEIIKYLEGT